MKKLALALGAAFTLLAATAFAFNPTLKNEDSKKYEYKVKCGGSTTNTSISGNTQQTLTSGNCTLDIPGVGTAALKADLRCVIKKGNLTCK